MKLLHSLLVLALLSLSHAIDPVCIVGAGPTGLTAAAKLQEKHVKTVIFEKASEAGGKCQAYDENGHYHPMGALFFSNETYRETLPVINQSGVMAAPFAFTFPSWLYYWKTGHLQVVPSAAELSQDPLFEEEIKRYIDFWVKEFQPQISIGYKNGVDGYTKSTAAWLKENNFTALYPFFVQNMAPYGYGNITEVPILYMLQQFTPDIALFLAGKNVGYTVDFREVWVRYAATLKDPINYNVSITKIDRRQGSPSVITYQQERRTKSQKCSKIIMAFPPVLQALENANIDLDDSEKAVFQHVGITKYWSGAVKMDTPNQTFYAGLLGNTPSGYVPFQPEDAGAPTAFFRLHNETKIASTWSWGKYGSSQTTEEARKLLIGTLSKLNKDPSNEKAQPTPITDDNVKAFKQWDYFPRVNQEQLEQGFYAKYHGLQGHRNTYYASGLSSVENVEQAVRTGIDIVDSYF